jgi:pimeloyl-ACP methyl ester carboxylesterase
MLDTSRKQEPVLARMRRTIRFSIGTALALLMLVALGPRPLIEEEITFDPASIGSDPSAWIAGREASVAGITDGAQKEIVWADPATKAKTPLSIVYVHGFSATKEETRPLPDIVARELGANLYYTRLAGHGSSGEALAEARMGDWVNDMAEAIAIGERLGERVLIIATSTGATLATWAASRPQLNVNVGGLVLISPNFELNGVSIGLLNMPWGRYVLPAVMGQTRSFEPSNEAHGKWWTTSYPSAAVFPMAALMKAVASIDKSTLKTPTMFVFSPSDKVVSPPAIRQAIASWGGPKEVEEVTDSDDPSQHVIAGDILSPSTTGRLAERIVAWAKAL